MTNVVGPAGTGSVGRAVPVDSVTGVTVVVRRGYQDSASGYGALVHYGIGAIIVLLIAILVVLIVR